MVGKKFQIQYGSCAKVLFWAALLILLPGLCLLNNDIKSINLAVSSANWPVAQGTVLDSGLGTNNTGHGNQQWFYSPVIVYTYNVGGKEYSSHSLAFARPETDESLNQEAVASFLRKYPIGQKVDVHYNPQEPSEAVILPGVNLYWPGLESPFVLSIAFGTAMTALACFLLSKTSPGILEVLTVLTLGGFISIVIGLLATVFVPRIFIAPNLPANARFVYPHPYTPE